MTAEGESLDYTKHGLTGIEYAYNNDRTRLMYFAWAQGREHERRVSPSPAHAGICEPETGDGNCRSCVDGKCTTGPECVACSNAPDVGKAQAPSPLLQKQALDALWGLRDAAQRSGREDSFNTVLRFLESAAIAQSAPRPVLLEAGKEGKQ